MAFDPNIPSFQDLHALTVVYLRAIALAWTDDKVGREFKERFLKEPELALEEYFNYKSPFAEDLEVFESTGAQWQPTQKNATGEVTEQGQWSRLAPNELIFSLPSQPQMHEEPIALAAYVDSGPCYLLTCC